MDILLRESGDVTIVELVGELNAVTQAAAQAKLLAAVRPNSKLALDMAGLSFMSSAGLRVLIMTHRAVVGKGGRLVLANLPEMISKTLQAVGLLDVLAHRDTLDEALAVLDGGAK